jgi:DnaJ-class molecular chaperone
VNEPRPKNYYEVLEVAADSPREEIEQGYLRAKNAFSSESLALYSLMSNDECEDILVQIDEAYSILSVPKKRKEYDKARGFNQNHRNPEVLYQQYAHEEPTSSPRNTHISTSEGQPAFAPKQNFKGEEAYKINRGNEVEVSKLSAQKRFNLTYAQDAEFEQEIENATSYTGEFLKKIREYKDVSIQRMSDMTKISKTYISAIEDENTDRLPAIVYIRGFVYQYAKCLKLNPDLVATSYTNYLKSKTAESA